MTVGATYNSRDLLANLTWSGGGIAPASVGMQYDAAGQNTEIDRFADTTGTNLVSKSLYTYDLNGQVKSISHLDGSGDAIANYQYTYDAAGELTQETHHGITFTYSYDRDGQLTSATRSDQPTPQALSYDQNGNRTDSGITVGADNRISQDSQFTYQYDNEGNLIQKVDKSTGDTTTYQYDFRNRLTDITTKSAGGATLLSEHYTYDVFDRRIAVTVNGVTTDTVYDGDNAWADYDASGHVLARYLFAGTDAILALATGQRHGVVFDGFARQRARHRQCRGPADRPHRLQPGRGGVVRDEPGRGRSLQVHRPRV